MIDDGNESEITTDEIMKALKRMKVGKAVGYDRVSSEMLRGGGEGEKVKQVKECANVGSLFANDGKHDIGIERRVNVGNEGNGTLFAITNSEILSRQARLAIHYGYAYVWY
ncbi:hypothetical protein EVAR_28941_1 [Eumeta japonica]|uniref:Uncharacterized protein n=1 Tax=Eumeta variegata TaxID=151549 RepID=A0A4C1VWX5_EUMVA|nr:hypothetical protein EVAR_28941_1 [Eumeta japonica]